MFKCRLFVYIPQSSVVSSPPFNQPPFNARNPQPRAGRLHLLRPCNLQQSQGEDPARGGDEGGKTLVKR